MIKQKKVLHKQHTRFVSYQYLEHHLKKMKMTINHPKFKYIEKYQAIQNHSQNDNLINLTYFGNFFTMYPTTKYVIKILASCSDVLLN